MIARPPPLASALLVDAALVGVLVFARDEPALAVAALALFAALRTVRVARRCAVGARRAVAFATALAVTAEAGLAALQPMALRTGPVAAAVLGAAVYAWVTSPALRR